jgi:predicted Fe-Mo cluster-binding NifX family protein
VRAYNCLKRSGLMTVGQLLEKSEDELLALRNFGRKSYEELRDKLIEMGLLQPPTQVSGDLSDLMPLQRTLTSGPGEESEDLSPLGAALIEALREAGEDPSDLLRRREEQEQ